MAVTYSKRSAYSETDTYGNALDVWTPRKIRKDPSDVLYVIEPVYQYRPDLMANDLYGSAELWWVFAARNPNTIKDPIFDFKNGTTIYIPKRANVITDLGL